LHATTGLDYSDMLFFDDEARNQEVEDLGVTFVLIGSDGVTHENFDEGIEEWRRRRLRK
jgi:magnesium-dependent phosphatase 1